MCTKIHQSKESKTYFDHSKSEKDDSFEDAHQLDQTKKI